MARPQMEQAQHVVVEESEPVALNQDLHSAGGRHLSGSKSRIFADDPERGGHMQVLNSPSPAPTLQPNVSISSLLKPTLALPPAAGPSGKPGRR